MPGEDDQETLLIRVIAESADGQQAAAVFQIEVNDQSAGRVLNDSALLVPEFFLPEHLQDAPQQPQAQQAEVSEDAGKPALNAQLAQHAAEQQQVAEQQLLQQLAQFNFDQTPAS